MPTKTFFNLPKDKQNKIINASKAEFSKYSFYDSSINRIIKDAEISRGSFYQYFLNKEDLFIFILDEYKLNIIEWLKTELLGKKNDMFEMYLLVYDYITKEGIGGKDKEFLITTISNMDTKLTQHLMKFLKLEDIKDNSSHFNSLVDLQDIKMKDPNKIMLLHNILMNIMMNQIILFFSNISDGEKCREELISKFELIKYGANNI